MSSVPPELLRAFGFAEAEVTPFGRGLINDTFALEHAGGRWVLQRINDIFSPEIHASMDAVSEHLLGKGIASPRLRPLESGALYAEHEGAVWRAQERLEGTSFDTARDANQLEAAAAFVARWHAALQDLEHAFAGQRLGVHDTAAHLAKLREALALHADHRLAAQVAPLANELFEQLDSLPPLPALSFRVAHGDLKLNNLLFAGAEGHAALEPRALIDLDTLGPMLAAHELGDALRSWCNRATEDQHEAQLDLEFYRAATGAYLDASHDDSREALAEAMWLGADWISLELSARFLADALNESYFNFDAKRFPAAGEHNLHRARGQWSLHRELAASRQARREMLR